MRDRRPQDDAWVPGFNHSMKIGNTGGRQAWRDLFQISSMLNSCRIGAFIKDSCRYGFEV